MLKSLFLSLSVLLIAVGLCAQDIPGGESDGVSAALQITRVLPDYYNAYLDEIVEEIVLLKKKEADGFFYWTDTHFPENSGYASAIIEYVQETIGPVKIFFGGDATKNAPSLSPGIEMFTASCLQAGSHGMFYPVRGNHDFTSTTSESELEPQTMDNKAVYEYLSSLSGADVIRDENVPASNYYYLDSAKGRLRYVVFDTTDNVVDGKIQYGISDRQMDWIFNHAVSTLPKGWKLIFISHVPLDSGHFNYEAITKAGDKIAALAPDGNVLLCLAGHRHSDMESGIGAIFQVLTESDCLVDCARTHTPYSLQTEPKRRGTVSEQTLDYVSISKNRRTVTFKRVGHGYDRIFNVRPIDVKTGTRVKLPRVAGNSPLWTIYNADMFSIGPYDETGLRKMQIDTDGIIMLDSNHVYCEKSGNYIAVALKKDGSRHFFMLSAR